MLRIGLVLALSGAMSVPALAQSKTSMLRVACDGSNVGAEITVNNRFKGECPIDVEVQPGEVRLRAYKKVDGLRERLFEQEFRVGEGVVKRVEVVLGPAQLNEEGRVQEAERQRVEAERRRVEEEKRRKEAEEKKRLDDERKRLEAERAAKEAEWKRLAPIQAEERRRFRLGEINAAFQGAGNVAGSGQAFRDCPGCPEMVWIPPGRPTPLEGNELRRWLSNVEFGTPFAVGKFEVTFAEWDQCVAERGCTRIPPSGKTEGIIFDSDWGRGRQPVINISPADARQYVAWLAGKTGQPYRLLSLAESHYVRYAGVRTTWPWGSNLAAGAANCVGCGSEWDGKQTTAVGVFPPNAWGVHDMIGNVAEFAADCLGSLSRLRVSTMAAFEQAIDVKNAPRDGRPLNACTTSTGATVSDPVYATAGGSWRFQPILVQYDALNTLGPSGGFRVAKGYVMPRRSHAPDQFSPFRDCADCPEMVNIPAGRFEMGLPYDAPQPMESQFPLRRVEVAAFAMGKTEVTRGQFASFVKDTNHQVTTTCLTMENTVNNRLGFSDRQDRHWQNPGFVQDDSHPVVCISLADARAYAVWLSRKAGQQYRLPTEAEWEYAARTDSASLALETGSTPICSFGNVADTTLKLATQWSGAECTDQFTYTAPVARFRANAWGLHDLVGNVSEMLEDCWNPNYFGAPGTGAAWKTGDCNRTLVRGTGWSGGHTAWTTRGTGSATGAAFRGFRIARDALAPQPTPPPAQTLPAATTPLKRD